MNCRVCQQIYNPQERKPIFVEPCGHTVCLECCVKSKKVKYLCCQTDVTEWRRTVGNNYPDNLAMLELVAELSETHKTLLE